MDLRKGRETGSEEAREEAGAEHRLITLRP